MNLLNHPQIAPHLARLAPGGELSHIGEAMEAGEVILLYGIPDPAIRFCGAAYVYSVFKVEPSVLHGHRLVDDSIPYATLRLLCKSPIGWALVNDRPITFDGKRIGRPSMFKELDRYEFS